MTYIFRRLLDSVVAVLGVVTIVFVITRLIGDPVAILLPEGASTRDIAVLRHELGLDEPIAVQYGRYLGAAVRGDFGNSFVNKRPAMSVVLERLPATAELAALGLFFGVLIGSRAGSTAARHPGTLRELFVLFGALIGQSVPSFWIGLILIVFFSVDLRWLPTSGYGSWKHLVLPTVVLALFVSAAVARLLRASLLDASTAEHVRTARAKGLRAGQVFRGHVMRNALLPVVSMVGLLAGDLLGGAVVLETVFAWPGLGRLLAQSIETRDFPVLQAGILVIAVIYLAINLATDLIYRMLDPRIGLGG
jgi:peptide/nickel transport system permease protein